jgi:hypothetical protein
MRDGSMDGGLESTRYHEIVVGSEIGADGTKLLIIVLISVAWTSTRRLSDAGLSTRPRVRARVGPFGGMCGLVMGRSPIIQAAGLVQASRWIQLTGIGFGGDAGRDGVIESW